MKKNIFILALCAIVAFGFTSCEPTDKSKTELLTVTKGWTLTAASSNPAYIMGGGATITDLYNDGFIYSCEKDDIITFETSGAQKLNPNKNICEGDGAITELTSLGNWSFADDEAKLNMHLPYFENSPKVKCHILSLDENTLKVQAQITYKETNEDYDMTFTYSRAK